MNKNHPKDKYECHEEPCPCDTCIMYDSCDGWEARYCCALCRYLGNDNCDSCDPWDI